MRLRELVYFNADEYFKGVLNAIDKAEAEVLVESYIFREGSMSAALFSHLRQARLRGVTVKLTIDAAGVYGETDELIQSCKESGFNLRIFHPILWSQLLKSFKFLNRRNHRKLFIIDSRVAFVGSVNITDAHIEKNEKGVAWKDYGISIEGPEVQELKRAFEKSFYKLLDTQRISRILRSFDHLNPKLGILLNDTLVKRREWRQQLIGRIQNASTRIWVANAYILPMFQVQKHLESAARRGVDVRLLTSGDTSDVFFMPWITSLYYRRNLKAGIEVYEYLPSFFHGKVLVIDDAMSIGSSNLNHRSILHDLEVEVDVLSDENKGLVINDLEKCFSESKHIDTSHIEDFPIWKIAIAKFLYLFKYWF